MTAFGGGFFGLPGLTAALENVEQITWWGRRDWQRFRGDVIYSAAQDAGADPVTLIRPGMIMGRIAAGSTGAGKITPWNPWATNGSQFIHGVMVVDQQMATNSVVADRWFGYCQVAGTLKASALLIAKASNAYGLAGTVEEYMVRNALTDTGRFQLDDQLQGAASRWAAYQFASLQTDPTAITLTAAQNGTLCLGNHSALTTYTLPAPVVGLRYGFFAQTNTGIAIQAATNGDLQFYNDAAGNKVTFSTNVKTIGAMIVAECIPTVSTTTLGPKWMLSFQGMPTTDGTALFPVYTT